MGRTYRTLIALVGSAALVYAAYVAAVRGLADWRSMRWRHDIATWNERGAIPAQNRLQEAISSLVDTLELTPDDPNLLEHMGIAHHLRANASPAGSGAWQMNLTWALIYFRKAAGLRPTSPYTWAMIVSTKYRLGQLDEEFLAALRHALEFGPWEPAVQLTVADSGLGAWEKLDSGLRDQVKENLRRTAVRQADALARIATLQRKIDVVCALSLDIMKNKVKCGR